MISVKNLTKNFGRLTALNRLNVSFEKGQVVSLVGSNGSGKTTFIKCLLGLVVPSGGQIFFENEDIAGRFDYRSNIGYMPQIGRYPDQMTVSQIFSMVKDIREKTTGLDEELVGAFGLAPFFDKPMRTLSGGTRQKVSACLAFLFNPEILILDEPTAGLDPLAAEILKEKISREHRHGKLILLSSHILDDLDELSTHVLYLQEGSLLFFSELTALRRETGEQKLGKILASRMRGDFPKMLHDPLHLPPDRLFCGVETLPGESAFEPTEQVFPGSPDEFEGDESGNSQTDFFK